MELLYFDELVREACLAIRPVAEAKLVHLQTAIGDAALPAIGNPASLRRLMWALIDNAVKYTEPGGSVSVSVEKAKDNICLKVADDGPGIPDSELPFLFERFYRGFYAKENGKSGAGLGLALANTIAKMHDSSIQVRSAVGRGSVFEVNIPSVMHDQANGLLSGCQLPSAEP